MVLCSLHRRPPSLHVTVMLESKGHGQKVRVMVLCSSHPRPPSLSCYRDVGE
jgi:hypothetical protein